MSRDEVRKYLDNMEAIKEYKVIKSENQRQDQKIQSLEKKPRTKSKNGKTRKFAHKIQ